VEKEYISNQIAVYKTNKKLIEFKDKLQHATTLNYAHIHAYGEKDVNNRNINSNIGLVLQDYSTGTGTNTVKVEVNMSPEDVQYVFSRLLTGQLEFELSQDRISPVKNENGKHFVSKLLIKRAVKGPDGKERMYPWFIQAENGYANAAGTGTGGTYIQPKSYLSEKKVFININDRDLYRILKRVNSYIDVWERYYGVILINEMIKLKNLQEEK